MMLYILIGFTSLIGLIHAYYNAWIFAMSANRDAYYNKMVHLAGGAVRFTWALFVLVLGIFYNTPWETTIFVLLLCGIWFFPVYNIVYNAFNRENWFYVGSIHSGTKSFMDKHFGKFYIPIYFILAALTILWFPLDLFNFFTLTLVESFRIRWFDWSVVAMLLIATILLVRKFRNTKS